MKTLLLILFAVVGLAQQADSPYDADGHLKAEHQIPAGHSCMQRRVFDENAQRLSARGAQPSARLHPCDCTYSCHVDANGNVTDTDGEKSVACKSFCSKDGRKCGCHPEPVCDDGNALADMNGRVIAEKARH